MPENSRTGLSRPPVSVNPATEIRTARSDGTVHVTAAVDASQPPAPSFDQALYHLARDEHSIGDFLVICSWWPWRSHASCASRLYRAIRSSRNEPDRSRRLSIVARSGGFRRGMAPHRRHRPLQGVNDTHGHLAGRGHQDGRADLGGVHRRIGAKIARVRISARPISIESLWVRIDAHARRRRRRSTISASEPEEAKLRELLGDRALYLEGSGEPRRLRDGAEASESDPLRRRVARRSTLDAHPLRREPFLEARNSPEMTASAMRRPTAAPNL